MKILITGSNGLLGQKLVKLLKAEPEVELIATARGKNRLKETAGYQYFSMDISNTEEVNQVITETKPEVIIHGAAMTQVDDCEKEQEKCWELNVTAVEHMVNAANKVGAHLVHVSTDFIFDGEAGPYDEQAQPNPVNYYGESKLAAEKLIIEKAKSWAIARTVLVYGIAEDMSRSNIVLWVKKSLEDGKAIKVVNDQWRTPTLAEDLAMGCYLIAKKKAKGIFNISGKELLTPYDMAQKTIDFFKLDGSSMEKADSTIFTQPAKRPPRTGFNLEKAEKELGYKPHSFDEGIALMAEQMKKGA